MRVGGHYQYNITSQPYKNLASGLNTPPVKDAQNVVSVGWALWFFWERDFFQLVCSTLSSSKSMCNSAILTRTEYIIKKYKIMLRASCLMLEKKMLWDENRESEKAGSRRESNPRHLWLEPPVLCHWATTVGWPLTFTILYIYCTGGTECLSHTPGSHSACAVRILLGVDQKILSIKIESMLSEFLILNAQRILPHAGNRWI